MADNIDKIAKSLQETVLAGYSQKLKCASYVTRTVKGKSIEEALRIKPEDVDKYFEGLPDESKHCAKLAIDTLKASLNKYESKEQKPKFSPAKRKKKDINERTAIF